MRFDDWADVERFALTTLAGVERSTSYGQPAVKVNGKLIASTGSEDGSFHVISSHEEKSVLLETDPDTFWQTAHYANWPGLLVRYGGTDAERVALVITRAWWDRLKAAQRKAHGPRP